MGLAIKHGDFPKLFWFTRGYHRLSASPSPYLQGLWGERRTWSRSSWHTVTMCFTPHSCPNWVQLRFNWSCFKKKNGFSDSISEQSQFSSQSSSFSRGRSAWRGRSDRCSMYASLINECMFVYINNYIYIYILYIVCSLQLCKWYVYINTYSNV